MQSLALYDNFILPHALEQCKSESQQEAYDTNSNCKDGVEKASHWLELAGEQELLGPMRFLKDRYFFTLLAL